MAKKHITDDHIITFRNGVTTDGDRKVEISSQTSIAFSSSTIITGPDNKDYFGLSVFVSGTRAVITAPNGLSGGSNGRGYIYNYDGESWNLSARISGSHIDTNDGIQFGGVDGSDQKRHTRAVHVLGDRVLVGALKEERNNDSHYQGAVYMYNSQSSGWARTRLQVTGASSTPNGGFGSSVLLGDDFFAVGHPNEYQDLAYENTGNTQGVIFTFNYGETNGNNYVQILTSSDRGSGQKFGSAMAFDYKNRLLITRQDGPSIEGEGSSTERVEIFGSSSAKGWNTTQKIATDAGYSDSEYGQSLDCCDDYLIVGAPNDRPGGDSLRGAAFIYKYSGGNYSLEQTLSGSVAGQLFGRSVTIASASQGVEEGTPGLITAVVGSQLDNDDGEDGMAHVYQSSSANGWLLAAEMKSASDDSAGYADDYATSVYLDGDFLLVGSYGEESYGRCYMYQPQITLTTNETSPLMRFNSKGPFNLRLQSNASNYKTFIGDSRS